MSIPEYSTEVQTMKTFFHTVALLAVFLIVFTVKLAAAQALAVPDAPVASDLPGAKELPDPKMVYKVVFDISKAAEKVDEVNPMLPAIARFLNTLAKNGVAASHRKIAVVIHQGGTPIILNND